MQAFHWFANEDSLREIHRVLKPTGGFIMFANREDDRDPWARAILCSFEPYSKVSNTFCSSFRINLPVPVVYHTHFSFCLIWMIFS